MGKLLPKLLTEIVPSWLTLLKSSPKNLLPDLNGSTHASSPSSSLPTHNTEVQQPWVACDDSEQSMKDMADDDDGGSSSKAQSHHHHHQGSCCKNQPGLEKRSNHCMPEEDSRDAQRDRHDFKHRELCDFLDIDRDGNVRVVREDNCLDNYHDTGYSCEAECAKEHCENSYHGLQGQKRKSEYQQEDEEGEEEADRGSRGSGGIDMKGWGQKRRKGERKVTSCNLPESICGIVGNGRAVIKHSQDPHVDMWESMVEMIVGNGLWEMGTLEFLLFCYLSLNEAHLHPIIHSCFLQVLQDLERI